MKKVDLKVESCEVCPYAQYTENGEYSNCGLHCQNGKLWDNIDKNGFKGKYEDDKSFIDDIDSYIHPNCPLEDV